MRSFLRCGVAMVMVSAMLGLAACQSSSETRAEEAGVSDHAVVCPACETVWVARPTLVGPRNIDRLQYERQMNCPACDKMATAYLQDGKAVLHNCPDCKVTPKAYKPRRGMDHTGDKHQH